jgi:hypothetical protein
MQAPLANTAPNDVEIHVLLKLFKTMKTLELESYGVEEVNPNQQASITGGADWEMVLMSINEFLSNPDYTFADITFTNNGGNWVGSGCYTYLGTTSCQ